MAISRSDDSELNEDLALGPGERLREARIARNLEVEDVAIRLRLHVKTINSIEADDYAHLPAPTFIRGYLRGYARLLALPCEPIIESYEQHGFAPPPLVRDISKRDEIKSTDFPVRIITYVIVGILIVFVTIWWQNQQVQLLSLDIGDIVVDPTVPDDSDTGMDPLSVAIMDKTSEKGAVDGDTLASNVPNLDDITTTQIRIQDGSSLEGDSSQGTNTGNATNVLSNDDGIESETDSNNATTLLENPPGNSDFNQLWISFTHESWVEIYGSGEKMLYYNLAQPGEIIDLREPGPMRVLLGYVDGVNVKVNGKQFDVKEHTMAGIAKFTLEAPSAIEQIQTLPQTN